MRNLLFIIMAVVLMACEQPVEIREVVKEVPVTVEPVSPPVTAPTETPVTVEPEPAPTETPVTVEPEPAPTETPPVETPPPVVEQPKPNTPEPSVPPVTEPKGPVTPTPTVPAQPPKIIVKNSLWQGIDVSSLVALSRSAADPSAAQVQAAIDAYNAAHSDDMLYLYEGEAPALEESPTADVYIVHPTTYHVNMSAIGIERSLLVTNIDGWRHDAYGQKLFVDHVPPAPVVVEIIGPYQKYALYVVNSGGGIEFEDHCGYDQSGSWIGGPEIIAGGWRDADHYYETRRTALWSEVVTHPGWRLIERQLYTEPEVIQ